MEKQIKDINKIIENLKVIDAKDMTAEELQAAIKEALKDMPFPDLSEIEKELRKEADLKKSKKLKELDSK